MVPAQNKKEANMLVYAVSVYVLRFQVEEPAKPKIQSHT